MQYLRLSSRGGRDHRHDLRSEARRWEVLRGARCEGVRVHLSKQAEAVAAHFVEAARRVREFRRPAAVRAAAVSGPRAAHTTSMTRTASASATPGRFILGCWTRRAGETRESAFPRTLLSGSERRHHRHAVSPILGLDGAEHQGRTLRVRGDGISSRALRALFLVRSGSPPPRRGCEEWRGVLAVRIWGASVSARGRLWQGNVWRRYRASAACMRLCDWGKVVVSRLRSSTRKQNQGRNHDPCHTPWHSPLLRLACRASTT